MVTTEGNDRKAHGYDKLIDPAKSCSKLEGCQRRDFREDVLRNGVGG